MATIHYFRGDSVRFDYTVTKELREYVPHAHQVWELIFLKTGNISYMVNGKVYHPDENSLIISRPREYHSICVRDDKPYARYNIQISPDMLSRDIGEQLSDGIDVINFDGNEMVCDLFPKLSYYRECFEGDTMKRLTLHISEEILCNAVLFSKSLASENMYTVNPIIQQAIQYIIDNITQPLKVDDVAKYLYVTKAHLHNLFLRHLKTTPRKFIVTKKLLLAQRDLRSGMKATKVYAGYGFSDYSCFYRHYTKYFGHTPSEEADIEIVFDTEP